MNSKTVWMLILFALASVYPAQAQQPKKVPRIVFLSSSDSGADKSRFNGIRESLREFGYIEGQNIVIEYRPGGRDLDR